jgi:hypothetical protein
MFDAYRIIKIEIMFDNPICVAKIEIMFDDECTKIWILNMKEIEIKFDDTHTALAG